MAIGGMDAPAFVSHLFADLASWLVYKFHAKQFTSMSI